MWGLSLYSNNGNNHWQVAGSSTKRFTSIIRLDGQRKPQRSSPRSLIKPVLEGIRPRVDKVKELAGVVTGRKGRAGMQNQADQPLSINLAIHSTNGKPPGSVPGL